MKKIVLLLTGFVALNSQMKAQTVTDIDGNVYNTVTIGTQTWMKENLKVTKYNDGTAIPLLTDGTSWSSGTPGYCWYNNDQLTYGNTYGALYNWHTVNTGNLCPTGWHVPTNDEWTTLTNFLGGLSVAGGKLKEVGTVHWNSPNEGATDEAGFTALPGGLRFNYNAKFNYIGSYAYFWSADPSYIYTAWMRNINRGQSKVDSSFASKGDGYSVRCLKDITTGIEESSSKKEMDIYPNPASNEFQISITEQKSKLSIYSITGELVFQSQLNNGQNKIDISNFESGIYLIEVENENGAMQQKLIKQ